MSYSYTIEVAPDPLAVNPREDHSRRRDPESRMVCQGLYWTRVPNEIHLDFTEFNGWCEVEAYLRERGAKTVVPVYCRDRANGQPAYSVEPHDAAWLFCGYIVSPKEGVAEELAGEVEDYSAWRSGQIYCYAIRDETGGLIRTCGNFRSRREAEAAARAAVVQLNPRNRELVAA